MILVSQTVAVKATDPLFPIQAFICLTLSTQCTDIRQFMAEQYEIKWVIYCIKESKVNSLFLVWTTESKLRVTVLSACFLFFFISYEMCLCMPSKARVCASACVSALSKAQMHSGVWFWFVGVRSVYHFQQSPKNSLREGSWEQHGRPFPRHKCSSKFPFSFLSLDTQIYGASSKRNT